MDASIAFAGVTTEEDAKALDELSEALHEDGIANQPIKAPLEPGRKAALTTGIAITKLVLSGIASLVSVLNFWQKTWPKYKVMVHRGNVKIEVENLSAYELQEAVKTLTAAIGEPKTEILLATK
jgi:hypothetical protein